MINKTKSWLFEKIKKIDKPLFSQTHQEKKGKGLKAIKSEDDKCRRTNTTETQRIIRDYLL